MLGSPCIYMCNLVVIDWWGSEGPQCGVFSPWREWTSAIGLSGALVLNRGVCRFEGLGATQFHLYCHDRLVFLSTVVVCLSPCVTFAFVLNVCAVDFSSLASLIGCHVDHLSNLVHLYVTAVLPPAIAC